MQIELTEEGYTLRPCPFCGGTNTDASMVRGYEAGDLTQPIIAAGCYDCGATGRSVRVPDHSTGYKEAADAWNTRASPKPVWVTDEISNEILPKFNTENWCNFCGVTIGDEHLPMCGNK